MRKPIHSVAVVCAIAVAITAAITLGHPAGADDPTALTNDASVLAATPSWWFTGITASELSTELTQHSARLTQLKVDDPTLGTFSAVMVANAGPYGSAYWWYYGITAAEVGTTLTSNNARLISVDPYETSGGLLFAVVEVPNTGAQDRAWEWFYGQTAAAVTTDVNAGTWRLTAIEPYTVSATTYYAIIMVANSGSDAKPWYYDISQPMSAIDAHVSDGYRVVSFTSDPSGGYDAILVYGEGEHWWFSSGDTSAQISQDIATHKSRLIDIDSYVSSGTRFWAIVELDNTNLLQAPINGGSVAVDTWAANSGWSGSVHGEYFAKVTQTGIAAPTIAANSIYRFEPASTIKFLYAAYAMHEVALHKLSTSSTITYYVDPSDPSNAGVCPSDAWDTPTNAVKLPLSKALPQMLHISDNRIARSFAVLFGVAKVNAWAKKIGMTSTSIGQPYIGCAFQGDLRNNLTLRDAGTLYGGIYNGKLISGTPRTELLSYDNAAPDPVNSQWSVMVKSEATTLGKASVVNAFLAHMASYDKAGSYGICDDSSCDPYEIDYSDAGLVVIPFKVKGKVVLRGYVYGGFVNDLTVPCSASCAIGNNAGTTLGNVGAHEAASTIASALRTW